MTDDKAKRPAQLHEVLAVDRELDAKDKNERAAAIDLFSNRLDLFTGNIKTLRMFDEADKAEEAQAVETKQIYLTANQVLAQALQHTVRFMDAVAQKERTNQNAIADVILDNGDVILENVPATTLLALERVLADVGKLYAVVPVLAAGVKWEPDANLGAGIFKQAHDATKLKTRTVKKPVTMFEGNEHHPPQFQMTDEVKNVGEYVEQKWAAFLQPARKMELMERIDELQRAVKKARMRANQTIIVPVQVGQKIVDWINMV